VSVTDSTIPASLLRNVPVLAGLSDALLAGLVEQLAAKSPTRRLAAGKWLFREQDAGDAMYVVRAGRLEVVDEGAGAVIGEYRRGDALGEAALLTDSPRSASVRATRTTEVIAVDQADFTELLHRSPALSLALNRSLSRRLQDARMPAPAARPRPATVALIALDGRIPLRRLAARLGAALQAHLSVAVLGDAEVPAAAASGSQLPSTGRGSTGRRPGTTWFCSSADPPCTSPGRSSASCRPTGSWP